MKYSIHVSDISAFLSCRRAWNWSSNLRQHLTTIRPYEPFYFGTVVHKFLEWYYNPMQRDAYPSTWLKPFIANQGPNSQAVAVRELELMSNAIPEFIEFGETLFEHYRQWAVNMHGNLGDESFDPISVEQPFDVPILTPAGFPSSKFRFAGRVDGVWRSRIDGQLYLHEIKTTSSIDGRLAQLQFEYQPTAYMLAMQEVYKEPIAGVVYTLIRKKLPADPDVLKNGLLSQNKGIDTTADHYLACIKKHHQNPTMGPNAIKIAYGDILSTLLNQPNRFFRRVLIKRSPGQLSEMRRILYDVARDMTNPKVAIYQSPGYFCNNCIFSTPCVALSQGQPIDPILSAHYTRNTRLD